MTTLIEMTPPAAAVKEPTFAIKVVGVGGAGGNAVSHLAAQQFPGVAFATVNTDAAALRPAAVGTRLSIGSRSMHGAIFSRCAAPPSAMSSRTRLRMFR